MNGSDRVLERNRLRIPAGLSSVNRLTDPNIAFARGEGARLWDVDGAEYIDYHGAFAPQLLGYGHPAVKRRVVETIEAGVDLFGSGPTALEGRLAELVAENIDWVERVAFFNSGSEATAQAIRLARAATGRDHVIVMQGGYNGWHNDVACNLATPLEKLGPRRKPGEYPFIPISAGIPEAHCELIHPVNFNDPESVAWVCERVPVAALIVEPILQNVGLIKPFPGYLEDLRRLADAFGFVLIFDEIKTGFRHAFGGCAEISGTAPDLAVYGKAIASGYPLAAIGGRARLMDLFAAADPDRRVLLAGTYNAHPVATAAAVATLETLLDGELYDRLEALGCVLEEGLRGILSESGAPGRVVRQGSAFVVYFMDHDPFDWHDLAAHHDFQLDEAFRREMIRRGIYFFPVATKQCSLSAAHDEEDVEKTLRICAEALRAAAGAAATRLLY